MLLHRLFGLGKLGTGCLERRLDAKKKKKKKKRMFLKGRSSLRKKKVKILVGGKIQELGEDPGGPGDVWG